MRLPAKRVVGSLFEPALLLKCCSCTMLLLVPLPPFEKKLRLNRLAAAAADEVGFAWVWRSGRFMRP